MIDLRACTCKRGRFIRYPGWPPGLVMCPYDFGLGHFVAGVGR